MSRSSLAGAAALVTVLSIGQKLVAFVREQAIAHAFGATGVSDAYLVGLTIPEWGWIVAAAGLTGTLVPVLSGLVERGSAPAARRAAGSAMLVAAAVAAVAVGLAYIFLPAILAPVTADWPAERGALAVTTGRLALPAVIAAAAAAALRALLHAHGVFHFTPLVVLVQNALVATVALTLVGMGPQVLAGAQVVGVGSYLVIFWWALRRRHETPLAGGVLNPDLRPATQLLVPLLVWAVAAQGYVAVDRFVGGTLSEGTVSALSYADKLRRLPLQTAMYAVTMVAYPALAAAVAGGDQERLGRVFAQAVRLVVMVALPVVLGLTLLNRPIVEVVYQRGAFDAEATTMTAAALQIMGLAVLPLGLAALLAHTHFSLGRPWMPVLSLAMGEGVHAAGGLALGGQYGIQGMAAAALAGSMVDLAVLGWSLRTLLRNHLADLWRQLRVPLQATMAMGIFSALSLPVLEWANGGLRSGLTLAVVALAALLYLAILWWGQVPELAAMRMALRRRLDRR